MPRQRVNSRRRKRGPKEEERARRNGPRKGDEKRPHSDRRDEASTRGQPQRSSTSSRELRRLLEGIGTPGPAPFEPDPFQLEALAALEHEDVLVTAPTGSGKTWIAREEIRRLLAAGKRAWYTSPLKALTNSKYQEFRDEFGDERVGILTGDRKENGDAPLVVGTTEIYRNQLFDALRGGTNIRADLVVLDEAHYLADEERGHVWEEAIILSPPRVRLLLLSATIGNAEEFASWISEVRGVHCGVVSRPGARPVPLRAAFLYPEGQLIPLLNEAGRLHPEIARLGERQQQQRQERAERRGDWRSRRGGGGSRR
ncbi:MAG TPA: DEAD/DEAH box helicase [Pyrinomonadaceae bacterium]|nr:DEAD/DEAH box helicase [Pyrinomonadaceae bacterium]